MENGKSLKVRIQHLGSALSSMVMPNIPALIAWGVLTALFIPDGFFPNKDFAEMVSPMLSYLIPLLIAYTAGKNVYEQRGGVVGAIAAMGAIVGAGIPMILGAMIIGPLGAWLIKKFDEMVTPHIKAGLEMLVNNFSAGLIGFGLALFSHWGIGPVVQGLTNLMAKGVDFLISAHLIPLANIFIEPAKILFLNNAINHGILTPLGLEQAKNAGKSLLFLLEANPGPGLGVLLAFWFFGKGSAKATAPGAVIIHFIGGIHEIYFPYVMMKPALFGAVIAGGVTGTFVNNILGSGLVAPASPGSIIAILGMASPKGIGNILAVLAGVAAATIVSFLVAAVILKRDKSMEDDFEKAQEQVSQAKSVSKGVDTADNEIGDIKHIIFACDAGMGSSAMGASILRDKVKKAGLKIDVTNKAISTLSDSDNTLIVTQEELSDRAKVKTPSASHVSVSNFLNSPKYDEIVARLSNQEVSPKAPQAAVEKVVISDEFKDIKRVVFAHDERVGSTTMGVSVLSSIFKEQGIAVPITEAEFEKLPNDAEVLIITKNTLTETAKKFAPNAQHLSVDSLITTPRYQALANALK